MLRFKRANDIEMPIGQIPRPCKLRWWDAEDIFDILRLRRDSSSSKLQCTLLLKLGSHYQRKSRSLCPWNSSQGFHYPTPLRFGDNSTYTSSVITFDLPRRYAPGIVRPAKHCLGDSSSNKFHCTTLLKLGTH